MKNRVTITYIANYLGLSTSTISRALKNHPSIGKETTKKIQKLASELGYSHNHIASNLRRKKTNLIGVMVPRIDRFFHSSVISGIEETANKAGYYIAIFQSMDSYPKEIENVEMLLSYRPDGVICCLSSETTNFEHFFKFNDYTIPLVFYDRVPQEMESSKVLIDDYNAAYKACTHLIDIGCKRIAHIAGNQNLSLYRQRLDGYKAALQKNRMKIDEKLICITQNLSREEGWESTSRLLQLNSPPDGLFCANDETAISAIQVAKKVKLHIPNDLAVVGFSNSPDSTIIEPTLTTIDDYSFEMGQAVARLLIRQIENKDKNIASETVIIHNRLIIRDSSTR